MHGPTPPFRRESTERSRFVRRRDPSARVPASLRTEQSAQECDLQDRLFPLHVALFTDASPGPIKYALGKVKPEWPMYLRLPMTPPNDASRAAVDAALVAAGVL